MTTKMQPLAVYAQHDQSRASPIVQAIGGALSFSASAAELGQPISAVSNLKVQVDASDPIILLVSSHSSGSPLIQSIANYAQQSGKRVIVIDLDSAGQSNIVGSLKQYGDTVIAACDPEIGEILESPDRWTLPSGDSYPDQDIKRQSKC